METVLKNVSIEIKISTWNVKYKATSICVKVLIKLAVNTVSIFFAAN